jgi:hypothetical protein
VVFNYFSVDQRLPLLAQSLLLRARFSLYRRISLLDQRLRMLLALLGYHLSDLELAKDTLEGVKAFQSLVHESQRLFIMGFVLSIIVELYESSVAFYCLVENSPLGRG